MDLFWKILKTPGFITVVAGVAAAIFGKLGMPGLAGLFENQELLNQISTIVMSLGGVTTVIGGAVAANSDPPK